MGLAVLPAALAVLPVALCLNNSVAQTPTVVARCFRNGFGTFDARLSYTPAMFSHLYCINCHRCAQSAHSAFCPLQMGFNTWNAYGPDIDEQLILQTAGFLNNLTLSKLGYNLIVLDGAPPTPRAYGALVNEVGLWRLRD